MKERKIKIEKCARFAFFCIFSCSTASDKRIAYNKQENVCKILKVCFRGCLHRRNAFFFLLPIETIICKCRIETFNVEC
jgi:hypothetical protein